MEERRGCGYCWRRQSDRVFAMATNDRFTLLCIPFRRFECEIRIRREDRRGSVKISRDRSTGNLGLPINVCDSNNRE